MRLIAHTIQSRPATLSQNGDGIRRYKRNSTSQRSREMILNVPVCFDCSYDPIGSNHPMIDGDDVLEYR